MDSLAGALRLQHRVAMLCKRARGLRVHAGALTGCCCSIAQCMLSARFDNAADLQCSHLTPAALDCVLCVLHRLFAEAHSILRVQVSFRLS